MAPPYLDSSPLSFPSDHDDLRYSDHLFFPTTPQASSSSSSLSFPLFPSDHGNNGDSSHLMELKREGGGIVPCNIGSCNNERTVGNDLAETGLRFTIWKQIDKSESSSCCENNIDDSVKWASSKMRLVVKSGRTETETATQMINGGRSFQDLNQSSPSDNTNKRSSCSSLNDGGVVIRTCSDCNTTKTPLWRSGPRGPKSLCNACGIRQRKARRAMAAAAAANNGATPCGGKPAVPKANKVQQQHKVIKPAAVNRNIPQPTLKRKCKDVVVAAGGGRKKLCFEDITISSRLSESSSSYQQRVFPQDEREAAILLMTLSYGLLHG